MSPFTNFESFFLGGGVGVCVGVGLSFAWAFAFACHVHAQGKHFQGTCSGACFLAAASLGGQCCTLSRAKSSGIMCTAGARLIPKKRHTKLTAFVARVSIAQWCQPYLSVFRGGRKTQTRSCGSNFRMRPERDDIETRGLRGLGKGDVRWVVEVENILVKHNVMVSYSCL